MKVKELMRRNVASLDPRSTIEEAAQTMADSDSGSLPVLSGGKPIGVISGRDIVVRALAEGLKPEETTVESVMTADPVYCREEDDVEKAAGLMIESRLRRILVLKETGELAGIVALGDLGAEKSDAAETLSSLIRNENAAAETYRQALQTIRGPGADELRRMEAEHEEAARALSERMRGGGRLPPPADGLWGAWSKAIEGSDRFFDEVAVLKILKLGEEQGAADYARALKSASIGLDVAEMIRGDLRPKAERRAEAIGRLIRLRKPGR